MSIRDVLIESAAAAAGIRIAAAFRFCGENCPRAQ